MCVCVCVCACVRCICYNYFVFVFVFVFAFVWDRFILLYKYCWGLFLSDLFDFGFVYCFRCQACRIYHLGVATLQNPGVHCKHAAQDGGGVCVGQATVADFCADFVDTCGGVGWKSASACKAEAAKLISGSEGATGGNTLACRIYHLGVAKGTGDTATPCGHAAANGDGVCVGAPVAADFCADYTSTCGADAECETNYANFFDGADGAAQGNTKGCRAYHLGVAKAVNAGVHCPHASKDGGGVCVGQTPTDFCSQYFKTCSPIAGDWADMAQCVAEFGATSEGSTADTGGDTQGCRAYHLGVAIGQDTTLHCGHASKTGDGVCVAPPITTTNFCSEFASTCGSEGVTYDDCATEFGAYDAGTTGDTGGNTQACRMYHLGAARTDPTAHCGHASSSGDSVCVAPAITTSNFCAIEREVCNATTSTYTNCSTDFSTHAVGIAGAVGGDSQACRIYHLGVARSTDAAAHCPHASANGGGVCVNQTITAANFCTKFTSTCAGFATFENCSTAFTTLNEGTKGAIDGDTQACRIYHLTVATSTSPELHCTHAGKTGNTVCVSTSSTEGSSSSSKNVFSRSNSATLYIILFVISFVIFEYMLYLKEAEKYKPVESESSTDGDVESGVTKQNPILDLNSKETEKPTGYLEVDSSEKPEQFGF